MDNFTRITSIQRYSVNDGPGFRTNVFLKGCRLKCKWCHNPETQSFMKEIYWKKRNCVECGKCFEVCPEHAICKPQSSTSDPGYHKINFNKCNFCLKCTEACNYSALEPVGTEMTVHEIMVEVEKDRIFYDNSGGGLTISGGEPLSHRQFCESLIDEAIERGLHICIDTSGFGKWDDLKCLAEKADIILMDLKHIDPEIHHELTGVRNEIILENLENLLKLNNCELWLRILVIPGYSDSSDYHKHMSNYLKDIQGSIDRIDLLPFHNYCEDKYSWLNKPWEMGDAESTDPFDLEIFLDYYYDIAKTVTIGGSGFEGN